MKMNIDVRIFYVEPVNNKYLNFGFHEFTFKQ